MSDEEMRMFDATDYGAYGGLVGELEAVGVRDISTSEAWCDVCGQCRTPRIVGLFGDFGICVQLCEPKLGVNGVWTLSVIHGGQLKRLATTDREDMAALLLTQIGRPGAPVEVVG